MADFGRIHKQALKIGGKLDPVFGAAQKKLGDKNPDHLLAAVAADDLNKQVAGESALSRITSANAAAELSAVKQKTTQRKNRRSTRSLLSN